ncbi:MAG: voltage-gated potassium channel [Saprospiraceae bacterium]|jgi:voltage-gated potassium channel
MSRFSKKIFDIVDEDNKAELPINKSIGLGIMILIILSVLAVILESDADLRAKYSIWFYNFELFAVTIFSFEYILRLYTAGYLYPEVSKSKARIAYMFSAMAMIDLLAILPFYMELAHTALLAFGINIVLDLRFIRVLRLMRLLRIFKLNRYSSSMKLISTVLKDEKEKLLITIFMTFILLILSSALIYTVENEAQPDSFPNIISSMWWAIATLTTVGYGDVYPVTALGKMLAGIIAILGIGLVALPTGILSSAFVSRISAQEEGDRLEAIEDSKNEIVEAIISHDHHSQEDIVCPHCGKKISEH